MRSQPLRFAITIAISLNFVFGSVPAFAKPAKKPQVASAKSATEGNATGPVVGFNGKDATAGWRIISQEKALDEKHSSTLFLQKYVHLADTAFPVSTVTHSIAPHDKILSDREGTKEANSIAQTLQKTLGSPDWTAEHDGDRHEYWVDWRERNRYIRVVYRNLGDRFSISISSTRRIYMLPGAAEARYIQVQLAEAQTRKVSFLDRLERDAAILPKAHALDNPLSALITLPGGQTLQITDQGTINNLLVQAKDTGNSLQANGQALIGSVTNGANKVVDNATGRVTDVVNNASGKAGALIDKAGLTARQTVDYTAAAGRNTIDYASASALNVEKQTIADTEAMIKRTTSFKNVFTTAFAAGLGGAGGAAVANLAIEFVTDGTIFVVDSVYRSIMGQLSEADKELMRKAAGQGFQDLEKATAEISRIEAEVDKRVAALTIAGNMPPGDLADQVATAIQFLGAKTDVLKARLRTPGHENDIQCAFAAAQGESSLNTLRAVQSMLVGEETSPQGVCAKIGSLLQDWAQAEARLNQAREAIARNSAAIFSEMSKQFAASQKDIGSQRRERNFCQENNSDIEKLAENIGASDTCKQAYFRRYSYDANAPLRDMGFERRVAADCREQAQAEARARVGFMNQSCRDASDQEAQRDHNAGLRNGLMLAQANIEAARAALTEITKKDCEEGVVTATCDGQSGAFFKLRQRYEKLYQLATEKCKNPPLFRPRAYADQGFKINEGIAPPQPSEPNTGQSSGDGTTWMGRQLSGVGRFFSSLWPF